MPRTRPRNSSESDQPRSEVFGEARPREEVLGSWKVSGGSRKSFGSSPSRAGAGMGAASAQPPIKVHEEGAPSPAAVANPFQGLDEVDC